MAPIGTEGPAAVAQTNQVLNTRILRISVTRDKGVEYSQCNMFHDVPILPSDCRNIPTDHIFPLLILLALLVLQK